MPHSENLFSQKEVAKRWGCDTSTIARREKDGVIKRAVAIPGVWYTRDSVERAEGKEKDHEYRNPRDTWFMKGLAKRAAWGLKEIEKRMEE